MTALVPVEGSCCSSEGGACCSDFQADLPRETWLQARLHVNTSSLHLVAQFFLLLRPCYLWVRGENTFPCSPFWNREFLPTTLQEALSEEKTIAALCPQLLSDPHVHPVFAQAICLPGHGALLCFISGMAGFQSPTLQRPWQITDCADPLEEGLAAL